MDGLLYCQEGDQGPIRLHRLDFGTTNCSLAETDGEHAHGPGCGHERVPHDDHHDWLVSVKKLMDLSLTSTQGLDVRQSCLLNKGLVTTLFVHCTCSFTSTINSVVAMDQPSPNLEG